ncbi:MAG: acyl carrier protein [Eubacteriales bacterium]
MLEKIKEIVSDFSKVDKEKITEDTNIADLGVDSLTMLKIIMELEHVFNIHFEDEEIVESRTVADLEENILKKKS